MEKQQTVEIHIYDKTYFILARDMPSNEEEKKKYIEKLEITGKGRLYYYAKHHPEELVEGKIFDLKITKSHCSGRHKIERTEEEKKAYREKARTYFREYRRRVRKEAKLVQCMA